MLKVAKSDNLFIVFGAVMLVALLSVIFLTSSCNSQVNNTNTNTNSNIKDYGVEYRQVNVYSGGKAVYQLKGMVGVKVDGDTVIVTNNSGKEYIFVNSDVVIKAVDKNESASNNEVSKNTSKETSKETSKVKSRETSKESSKESSKVYENSGARQTSDVSQVSYVSTVSN